MEKLKFAVLGIMLVLLAPLDAVSSGVYGGFDIDNEGQIFSYLGGMTGGAIFANVIAGYNRYEFKDNGMIREARSLFVTPAIGIKREGPLTLTLTAGPTIREKEEEKESGNDLTTEVGATFQAGAFYWGNNRTMDCLASISTLDTFFWSRIRGKQSIAHNLYGGVELFWMGNDDFESWGLGPLLEMRMKKVSLGLKTGYKNTSTFHDGFYVGIEFFTPL